jgi:hypothetical protein
VIENQGVGRMRGVTNFLEFPLCLIR